MSLTKRIQATATKIFQASDGAMYILQMVNSTTLIVAQGALPDLLRSEAPAGVDEKVYMEQLLASNPEQAAKIVEMGMNMRPATLKAGLIGEVLPTGESVYFTFVSKPAHQLQDGEINVDLIPLELAKELEVEIKKIGQPAVEAADTARFPDQ
ncbi:hypothetical protein [Deinococcus peraridilitoris]|uniref:Uncharacterized protein n=1 Tax=Deinococcus peraridilitoris (strain DSM 19664 / LMG 22246 / CIP 109416 / KR-200) TaxID=937777 RepID=L0A1C2_DEIPD|nr:hypothetical protein [Deinococcus peraridilitoris]AFZ66982.1 hypothetical protein Deipe_1441 [Deinococcus peraridilitoris DSM 19664]